MSKYRLSDSRTEEFLSEDFEEEIANIAYKAYLLCDAIEAAEDVAYLIKEIEAEINPESFNDREQEVEFDDDQTYDEDDEDKEDYEFFDYWIKEIQSALPRKGDPISAFFELDIKIRNANNDYLWRGPKWRSILVSVADKIKAVQKADVQAPNKVRTTALTAEVVDHDALPVDSLFDIEIKRATELYEEALKPSNGNAQSLPEIAESAMQRALSVALSDWADPNQRCAAITIAIALIVCPEEVILSKRKGIKVSVVKEVEACYKGVEIILPRIGVEAKSWFFLNRTLGMGRASPAHLGLENLAVSYLDAERNKGCLAHLREYLDVNGDKIEMAAVLGLAWLLLQRRERSISQLLSSQEGYIMQCSDPALGIRVKKKIEEAWYQGLRKPEVSV